MLNKFLNGGSMAWECPSCGNHQMNNDWCLFCGYVPTVEDEEDDDNG